MFSPEALERQVHRIHELLERSHDNVIWNDHIPDPDNPQPWRQIDIAIRRDSGLTIIECRLSRRRQDVKWIEEIIGRKQSLQAQAAIAVASAGFTIGAQKKALRYGVTLHDLLNLTEEEVTNWGQQVALALYYYQYSDVNLAVGFAPTSAHNIDLTILNKELRSHAVLQSVFEMAAKQLDSLKLLARNDTRLINLRLLVQPENAFACGERILEIELRARARLVEQPLHTQRIFAYGEPSRSRSRRDVVVEQFRLGETSVVHHEDAIALDLDLTSPCLPPLSQIRYVCTQSKNEVRHESMAITNPERLGVAGPVKVGVYVLAPEHGS